MRFLVLFAAFGLASCGSVSASGGDDPYLWLEDVHGQRALEWVKAENAKSTARLDGDKRFATYRSEALAILTAKDRLSYPDFRANGVDSLWQDAAHPHGLWRHASLASYRAGKPRWQTVLDLDALSKAEGKNWFFKGADCLAPEDQLCLMSLSDGGGDAVELREFDAKTKTFVKGGFQLDRAKQNTEWVDRDTLLVARPTSNADTTDSGYPFVIHELKRGQAWGQAKEVFRGERKDTSVAPRVLRDADGKLAAIVAERRVGFFEAEFHLLDGGRKLKLNLPLRTNFRGFVDEQLIFSLQEKFMTFESGALVSLDLETTRTALDLGAKSAETADDVFVQPQLIMQPSASQTIDGVQATRNHVVVQLLDNVKGAVEVYARDKSDWRGKRLNLPKDSQLIVRAAQKSGSLLFVTSESFLEPTKLWWADAATQNVGAMRALPARFKASAHTVEQNWATSRDGTKIPYFLVRPKKMKVDGTTPTILFGYGGFQLSKPPAYIPEMGKLWLERGGAFVIANIRGGGEFGPAWHQSALRENRQRAFDDFAAVGEDLIKRKVTSPRRLGIYGRSNGGVLTTVSMTQRPDLFNAVVVESPLVDMLRYHKLSAGASWVSEYGNADVPGDRPFIEAYSAYQKLKPGAKYPEPYITTNTEDDRVHPGHARKFSARLAELGVPYIYYENTFGGHSNDADPAMNADRWAKHYIYLTQKLMD
ncbi:MAG: S9 family peptidase [Alphaproteobacteria bacterium]|nr:S9 family peptidase [Alphaproteobacteria bacterium]